MLKTFTMADIRSWGPCYDPTKYAPEDWSGNALDVLKHSDIPAEDKAWLVLRENLIDERTFRLFAVACAREALKLIPGPDPRSIAACDVAERYANGQESDQELAAARDAAWAAARDAAWAAASDAAWAARAAREARAAAWAARGAASDAASDAARDASAAASDARAAASDAAWAARAAAWAANDARAAASDAAWAAWAAARDAAWAAARAKQIEILIGLIEAQEQAPAVVAE
ncbi:MAG: hypothetical protein JST01_14375 [Cyanobacteria bacterium SZAS TMP-1]|nr:hypothetical protein [Cyanobacteria bacterium SZAS TMP-1]